MNILITGATNGVGKALARLLSKRNGITLGIIGRSPNKLQELKEELQTNNNKILTYTADLSLLKSTQDAIDKIKKDFISLDIIFNNAGAAFAKRIMTIEGYESTLATNYLTMFLLNTRLLPLVKEAAIINGRASIVNTTSVMNKFVPVWDDINMNNRPFNKKNEAYQQSKNMVTLHTFDLAKQLVNDNVYVNCIHPGWIPTSGLMSGIPLPFPINIMVKFLSPFLSITPEKSAESFIWIAFDDASKAITGEYITDKKIGKSWKPTYDENNQVRLRKLSEQIISNF